MPLHSSFITAVVVTRNRLPKLKMAIGHLLAEGVDHLVVVDNGSEDGTQAWLESIAGGKVEVVLTGQNLGGAGGFEVGVDRALRQPTDWLLLQDDDAWPASGALAAFRALAYPRKVGIVGTAVRTPAGEIVEMNRQGINPLRNPCRLIRRLFAGRNELSDAAFSGTCSLAVDFTSFVGMFVRSEVAAKSGVRPCAGIFIYGDDSWFCQDASDAGWGILFDPRVGYVHDTVAGHGSGIIRPEWRIYYWVRNKLMILRRICPSPLYAHFRGNLLREWEARAVQYPDPLRVRALISLAHADAEIGRMDRSLEEVMRHA